MPRTGVSTEVRPIVPRTVEDLFRFPELLLGRSVFPGEPIMRVDAFEKDGALVVRADLPGIDPDKDVDVRIEDGALTIRAERRESEKQEGVYRVSEVEYGIFSKTLNLPAGCQTDKIAATYKDGVLEVQVPLGKEKPTRIPIHKA